MTTQANSNGNIFIEVTGRAFWAQVQRPTKDATWTIDIVPENAEQEAILTAAGLSPSKNSANKGGGLKSYPEFLGNVYHFKRGLVNKSQGTNRTPPSVLDTQGTPTNVLIGNGSKVVLRGTVRPYNFLGKSGMTASFYEVQIADLVAYTGGKKPSKAIEGSFVAAKNEVKTSEDESVSLADGSDDNTEDLGILS